MTPEQLQGWLQLGIGGTLLAALFLGHRRVWVFGWTYRERETDLMKRIREMQDDRDEWKRMAMRSLNATQRATEVADKATAVAEKVAQ